MRAGTAQVGMTCGVHWRIRGLILLLLTLVWHPPLTSGFQGRLGRARVSTPLPMALAGGQQSFNPFSSRNRNKNIQWFEADLETFYRFVEQQPLLTNEQEIKYGRALRMWQKVEELREKMQMIKIEQEDAEAEALDLRRFDEVLQGRRLLRNALTGKVANDGQVSLTVPAQTAWVLDVE